MNKIVIAMNILICSLMRAVIGLNVDESFILDKVDSNTMHKVYNPIANCMITNASDSKISFDSYFQKCQNDLKYYESDKNPFGALSSLNTSCCLSDMSIYERNFDKVINKYKKNVFDNPILDFLIMLSYKDLAFVSFGDSMNSQFHKAMILEIQRQNVKGIFLDENIMLANVSYVRTLWIPPKKTYSYRGSFIDNHVYSYSFRYDTGFDGDDSQVRNAIEYLNINGNSFGSKKGLIVFGNIGLHLNDYRSEPNDKLNSIMNDLLVWLNNLTLSNVNTIAAYRETTSTHFYSLNSDGLYEHSIAEAKETSKTSKHAAKYCCYPINSNSTANENNAVISILKSWGKSCTLGIIQTYKYFLPYWTSHFGHCKSKVFCDCVHFCAFNPLMWLPIWFEYKHFLERNMVDNEV